MEESLDAFVAMLRLSGSPGQNNNLSASSISSFRVVDIGDGNLNEVHRLISHKDSQNTAIVKYAPPFIKILGPQHPLSTRRIESEFTALKWFHRLVPGCVPEPYFNNVTGHSFVMEDLSGYEVMRKQLVRGVLSLEAARKIVRALCNVHSRTREEEIGREKFTRLTEDLKNEEMVALTRDFVFTFPFRRDHPTNRCSSGVSRHLALIYENDELLRNVAELTATFTDKMDCLLHGDMHTGSIMTNGPDAKMIDLEFAFIGPMGFDLGTILANYLFSYHAHRLESGTDTDFAERVRSAAKETISEYFGKMESRLSRDKLSTLLREAVGFAGCELVRRIVGAAHVEDLDCSSEAEVVCLKLGIKLILEHKQLIFTSTPDISNVFQL